MKSIVQRSFGRAAAGGIWEIGPTMRVFALRPSHPSAGRVYHPATLPERVSVPLGSVCDVLGIDAATLARIVRRRAAMRVAHRQTRLTARPPPPTSTHMVARDGD